MSDYNPTDDELRTIAIDAPEAGPVARDLARLVLREREKLAELAWAEMFTGQGCQRGIHADWFVDSEYNHLCPWCALDQARAALDRVEALCEEETGDCHTIPCARCEFAQRVRVAMGGRAAAIAGDPPAAVAVPHIFEPPPIGWAVAMNAPPPCAALVDSALLPGLPGTCRKPSDDPIHQMPAPTFRKSDSTRPSGGQR